MPVYSLIKFSDPANVSSKRCALLGKVSAAYAASHRLAIEPTKRKSAKTEFKGSNCPDPALRFLNAIENGSVSSGSILLAESLEGMMRGNQREIPQRFADIIAKGITIITFPDQVVHTHKSLAKNPEQLLASVMAMFKVQEATELRRLIAHQGIALSKRK